METPWRKGKVSNQRWLPAPLLYQGYDVGDLPDNSRDLMERILNDAEARYTNVRCCMMPCLHDDVTMRL